MTILRNLLITALLGLAAFAMGAKPNAFTPNVSVHIYQRIYQVNKPIILPVSFYNLHSVQLSLYRVKVEDIIPNAKVLENSYNEKDPLSAANRLQKMKLSRPYRTQQVATKDKYYNNYWFYKNVKLEKLPEGVYVVEVKGYGITKRSWVAVSSQALLVKRSPDVVKAWLVNTKDGKPVNGAQLKLFNETGYVETVITGSDGLATFKTAPKPKELLWIASQGKSPAFSRASQPNIEKPFRTYFYTDRPIYRPGQLVQYRGTLRAVKRGALSLPNIESVHVQIKVRGDSIVADKHIPLNKWGSFSGEYQLAPEPPLGNYSVEVSVGDYREYYSFNVQAYRKPEFSASATIPDKHYFGGDVIPITISANYYAGSPVTGAKVNYQITFYQNGGQVPTNIMNAVGLGSQASIGIEEPINGTTILDKDGKFVLKVSTKVVPMSRTINVNATVTDSANREQSASVGTTINYADYNLSISVDKPQYLPKKPVDINVYASNLEGKPVMTKATVKVIEYLTDREGRQYEKEVKLNAATNKDGKGTVTYTPMHPGWYKLEVWGVDSKGNAIYSEGGINVVEKLEVPTTPTLDTYFLKDNYKPGDIAKLHVTSSLVGTPYLLTIEGEELYKMEVGKIPAKEFNIDIPVKAEYLRGVYVMMYAVKDGECNRFNTSLSVPASKKLLNIKLTPDKTVYKPGETASYDVVVTNSDNKGVESEVGLNVVDASIYAIQGDNTANPYNIFWNRQEMRVSDDYSLSGTYPGGAYQVVSQHGYNDVILTALGGNFSNIMMRNGQMPLQIHDRSPVGVSIRRNFADTAYWAPSLITDADGHGKFTFTVPDTLTSWRTNACALTADSSGGKTSDDVKVNLPLMVRLALPRFYVQHDEATAAAIVQNYSEVEKTAKVTLTADGVSVSGAQEQTVTLPPNGIKRLTWKVNVTGEDAAVFLCSADAGPGAQDATESTLPILPDGAKRVDAQAGMTDTSTKLKMKLPDGAIMKNSKLEISVSPSVAGPIFDALQYLVEYPYGCAEQTMSQFLPNVIVAKAMRDLNTGRPVPKMLDRYVNFGTQKLMRFQHGDGGWNWWEFDTSDPGITAYIVYGLSMARDAGYPMAEASIPRGVNYLTSHMNTNSPAEAAYMLRALMVSKVWNDNIAKMTVKMADELIKKEKTLDIFSRASLVLALEDLSKQKGMAKYHDNAVAIADGLDGKTIATGTIAHWSANLTGGTMPYWGSWRDNDVEVTSQVMQALLAVKPKSENITPAVRWLMAAREDRGWSSSKDTASAVMALTEYLKQTQELEPNYSLTVKVNGKDVKTLNFTKKDAFLDPVTITVPAADLKAGNNEIELVKNGTGNLYWNSRIHYVLPAEQATPSTGDIRITRKYQVVSEDPIDAGNQPPGAMIQVTTTLTANQNFRYMLLEEPIPAGCEITSSYDDGYEYYYRQPYNRREVWDDRILYYFDNVGKGEQTITYYLRTEAPGKYRIRPTSAWLMYQPEVRGEGKFVRLNVTEE
ncbi:MAG: MG2 domain-containing protein [bacterium]